MNNFGLFFLKASLGFAVLSILVGFLYVNGRSSGYEALKRSNYCVSKLVKTETLLFGAKRTEITITETTLKKPLNVFIYNEEKLYPEVLKLAQSNQAFTVFGNVGSSKSRPLSIKPEQIKVGCTLTTSK